MHPLLPVYQSQLVTQALEGVQEEEELEVLLLKDVEGEGEEQEEEVVSEGEALV